MIPDIGSDGEPISSTISMEACAGKDAAETKVPEFMAQFMVKHSPPVSPPELNVPIVMTGEA